LARAFKFLAKCSKPWPGFGFAGICQDRKLLHGMNLLRQRPRSRRSAEEPDESAAFQLIEMHLCLYRSISWESAARPLRC
jgi:hypothetical protein